MPSTKIAITTTGEDGSASGSATTETVIDGFLEEIYIDYDASAPITTDVTLTRASNEGRVLFSRVNTATDTPFYPMDVGHDAGLTAGTELANSFKKIYVGTKITVSLAECDAITDAITAYIYWSRKD